MERKSVVLLIILISLTQIISIDPCSLVNNVNTLDDCQKNSTSYNDTICCLRTIYTSEGKELSCFSMNIKNKTSTIRYYYNGVTGILSCGCWGLELTGIWLFFFFIFLYI